MQANELNQKLADKNTVYLEIEQITSNTILAEILIKKCISENVTF